jgi:hypothetical protein
MECGEASPLWLSRGAGVPPKAARPSAPFTTVLPQHVGKNQPLAERGCGGKVAGSHGPHLNGYSAGMAS